MQVLLSCTPRLAAGAMRLAADLRLSARFVMQMPMRQDKGAVEAGSVEAAQHHIHQQCKDNNIQLGGSDGAINGVCHPRRMCFSQLAARKTLPGRQRLPV